MNGIIIRKIPYDNITSKKTNLLPYSLLDRKDTYIPFDSEESCVDRAIIIAYKLKQVAYNPDYDW